MIHMLSFQEVIEKRRTNYALGKHIPVSQDQIIKTIRSVVPEVPSAFNMQSGNIIVAFGENHQKIWDITKNILKGIVPPENFSTTESKIDSFAAAYGTILYFDDTQIIKQMQEQYALYTDNFPVWGQQANGMMQFALWSALSELGLGVNLQHYNPLIDEEIKKAFQVPESWKLIAQMPFGEAVNQPDPIQKKSVDERVLIFK